MSKQKHNKKRIIRENLPYRDCVGIVVFNNQGKVWAGHRLREEMDENASDANLWQLPQGGIDKGEQPLTAAKRELYEETGIHSITLLAEVPDWLFYDLPDDVLAIALKGKYRGQRQKWFAFHFTGQDDEIAINPPPQGHQPEFDEWAWVDLSTLPEMVVAFKRDVYQTLTTTFLPLVSRFA